MGRFLVATVLLIMSGLALWHAIHPEPSDPKGPRYQGWKLGIYPLDPDIALDAMIADPHRDKLVMGKTKGELAKRFGYVTSIGEASKHVQLCYADSHLRGKPALVLRDSWWVIAMEDGRAIDMVYEKGC